MKRQTAKVSQPRDPAVDESYAVVGAENKLIGIRDLSREPVLHVIDNLKDIRVNIKLKMANDDVSSIIAIRVIRIG